MVDDLAPQPCMIHAPYLLVLNAGVTISPDGGVYTDRSWASDLIEHTTYIENMVFLAPIIRQQPPASYVKLDTSGFRLVSFEHFHRRIGCLIAVPKLISHLLREVPRADIVHTCIAGWPFPVGWIAVPIARLFNKKIVIIVESSFWRIPKGTNASLVRRGRAWIWELLNKWCLRQADYAAYPHEEYRKSLPAPRAGGGVLFQASWISAANILPREMIERRWTVRIADGASPRFLFAARMVSEKGTRVLAEAVRVLETRGVDVHIDFIGTGPEHDMLRALRAETHWLGEHVHILDPIDYGPKFFALLGAYDAVLVPSLSDEQPRIIYDAYSQGVPAIASDMPGLTVCVERDVTGAVVRTGDPAALADAIMAAATDRVTSQARGLAGRELAMRFTHQRMHGDRCIGLKRLVEEA